MAQEEIPKDMEKEAQIQPKEELEEINMGTNPGTPRPINNQLSEKEKE